MIRIASIALMVLIAWPCIAQQCDGSLGENIFTRGSFGSGMENNVSTNPNIAPGYQYTQFGPPGDGFYVLTNNTGEWENLFPTWLSIQDNSPDPNGYMMVVNADFEPGIFYEELVTDLCENTLYELSVDVINLVRSTVNNHELPQIDFFLNDEVQFSTGPIPQSETWINFGFTFRTSPGIEEMTLSLRNNAPGGIGNDLALDNITFRPCGPRAFIEYDATETIFLCENDNRDITFSADIGNTGYQVVWQLSRDGGITWEDLLTSQNAGIIHREFLPGTYRYRYLAAPSPESLDNVKCRTISDELEIEVLPIRHTVFDTICAGLPYPLGDQQILTPGTHMASLISSKGCDSIVTLELTHVAPADIDIEFSVENPICAGDSTGAFIINGAVGGQAPYQFLIDDTPISIGRTTGFSAGNYQLEVKDRHQCMDGQNIGLTDPARFQIAAGSDTSLFFGDVFTRKIISSAEVDQVNWSPPAFLECPTCERTQIFGVESIGYLITAMSDLGCIATDSLYISVDGEIRSYVPNAFSPNGDGINDFFNIAAPGSSVQVVEELLIFNRWGSLIYEDNDIPINSDTGGWDGTINGEDAPIDAYLYSATLLLLDNTRKKLAGTVQVVR